MLIRSLHNLRWPLLGAAAGALAFAATALAGSGVGGVFNLGVENVVNASTRLTGSTPSNPQLLVTNNASGAAIRGDSGPGVALRGSSGGGTGVEGSSNGGTGVIGTHAAAAGANPGILGQTSSTDPGSAGVVARNTGGGPGLSAIVSSHAVPPLKVNSTARVPFLNADYVDGRHANGLVRLASTSDSDFSPASTFSDLRTISITAPTSGFVLLTGSAQGRTDSPFCNPCVFWLQLRDPSNPDDEPISHGASVGNGTSNFNASSITVTSVVPVTAGPHSFVLQSTQFPPDTSFIDIGNETVSALFVPFNGAGNSP